MGKRCCRFLLLLLVLVSVSVRCCHSESRIPAPEDAAPSEDEGVEDEDDLEDLDEGMDPDARTFSSADATAAAKVANVNDRDAARVLTSFEFVLLLGYAPWCTQSQALLPEFAAAALRLSQLGNPALLAKLDAINNPSAASQCEIHGFPTLAFFINGTRHPYLGGQSRNEIVLWVRKKTGYAVTTITSQEDAESFLRKNATAVLGYFETLTVSEAPDFWFRVSTILVIGGLWSDMRELWLVQGSEHDAFVAAAEAEAETEFVQTTVAEVAHLFAEGFTISPPFVAVRKQEPEHFTAFGMG
jgi:protein disulfide-isomerase A1